jgi:DNA-binding SARP family transcriptional activator
MSIQQTTVMPGDGRQPFDASYQEDGMPSGFRVTWHLAPPDQDHSPTARVALLGGFRLSCEGSPVSLPLTVQRLVALLALHDRPLLRGYVAGLLWADSSEDNANASLRTALWRAQQSGYKLVHSTRTHLQLAAHVEVDVREMVSQALRLSDPSAACDPADLDPRPLSHGLLPDWYDEWVLVERERLAHLRLQALESLCERLLADRRPAEAAGAALAAVTTDPFRESAQRLLIRAYLAQGNQAEAIRRHAEYQRYLLEELGVAPSPQMAELMSQVRA